MAEYWRPRADHERPWANKGKENMKDVGLVLLVNSASIIFAVFAGLTIYKKGFIEGAGWLIFAAIVCASTSIKFK